MTVDPAEVRAWARENKAAWEIAPLVEMHGGQRMQVGFELELFVRLPPQAARTADERAVEALWDRLREVALSLVPLAGDGARIEVEPFDVEERLRPETGFAPEVLLQARLFHARDYFAPVEDGDRARVAPLEARLAELGLREKSW